MFEKVCWILLVNLVFFAKTLCFKYSSDDIPVYNAALPYRNNWERFIFWLDGRRREQPQADHFLTTLLHAATCAFIYAGFGKIEIAAGGTGDISFWAALFFSVNPTNNQGSVWISGRAYALAALGLTMALTFPVFAFWGILLATFTNAGFLAPLVFVGSPYLGLLAVAPLAWFINWKRFRGNVQKKMDMEMITEDKAIKPEKITLVLKTFGFYTLLTLIPFQNAFYHSFLQSSSGSGTAKAYSRRDRFFWIGLIFAVLILTYFVMVPWNLISFGLLWWCICLAPFCNFMRMSQETAERYCYLPAAGLMVALAGFVIQYPIVIAIILTMYATRMWFLMDMYQDDYYLLEHSCLQDPSAWFVLHQRAIKRWQTESYQEALILWNMARKISPNEFKIHVCLATCLVTHGFPEEARHHIKIAENNMPLGMEAQCKAVIAEWKSGQHKVIL